MMNYEKDVRNVEIKVQYCGENVKVSSISTLERIFHNIPGRYFFSEHQYSPSAFYSLVQGPQP